MLQRNPSSLRLWTKYIDFKQTSIGSFKYEEVRSDYLDCLSLLQRARIDNRQSTFVQQNIFDSQIYVLLRMTRFMEEAGYLENAIAAWQALLEYQFFRPASVQANESAVSSFEAFWESEVPRIGEHSAEGWARFCEKQREPPQPRKQAPDAPIDESDIWTSWPDSEHRNSLRSRKPARTSDDVAEQDPYRVILFSDVRPFLVDSPSDSGKQAILDAYLAFYNLPSYQAESLDGHSRLWGRDGFVRKYGLESDGNVQDLGRPPKFDRHATSSETVEVDDYDPSRSKPGRDPFEFPIPDYQVSSDSLFANSGSWFSVFDAWLAKYSRDDVLVDWLLLSLQMLINIGAGADSLAVFVLALELRKSPGTVRKTAKNMLKKRPSSAPLYNAYAIIEYRLGNTSKGEDVLAASIKMGRQLDGVDQRGSPLLLRTWIWEILSTGQVQEAFQRLLAVGSEESQLSNSKLNLSESPGSVKPALLLRTERVRLILLKCAILMNQRLSLPRATTCCRSAHTPRQRLRSNASFFSPTSEIISPYPLQRQPSKVTSLLCQVMRILALRVMNTSISRSPACCSSMLPTPTTSNLRKFAFFSQRA